MAYCATTDLINGDIPLPPYVDKEKVVQDAADEIDSNIGFIYKTPVDVTENGPTPRPVRLLLKRINSHLATGRLIMALDSSGQDDRLHAYGYSLVQNALAALAEIAAGKIVLADVPAADENADKRVTAVIVNNKDEESAVDAFYDRIANPAYFYGGFGLGESLVRR